jgi:hypothetical protein
MKKPIILNYREEREWCGEKIFTYDYSLDMNVVVSNRRKLFIDADNLSYSANTETRVGRESDDVDFQPLELLTKTEATRERDDEENSIMLELESKTFADRERDDEDDYYLN